MVMVVSPGLVGRRVAAGFVTHRGVDRSAWQIRKRRRLSRQSRTPAGAHAIQPTQREGRIKRRFGGSPEPRTRRLATPARTQSMMRDPFNRFE
jgi:hypothetical protein